MDRDGHQGWSRASEAGWLRAFGPRTISRAAALAAASPNALRLTAKPGDVFVQDGRRLQVTPDYRLEEVQ